MGTFKISVKRKPFQTDTSFNEKFLDLFPPRKKKITVNKNYGVLTACDRKLFVGLQLLLSSVCYSYNVRVRVFDTGMTEEQVAWCRRQPGVVCTPFAHNLTIGDHIEYPGAWLKPFYARHSPFKHTIWVDADTMLKGDLRELLDCLGPNPLFTMDYSQMQPSTLNHPDLYKMLPVRRVQQDIRPYLNTGVYAFYGRRDKKIITDWCNCVQFAFKSKEVAAAVSCWDQGAGKWALQKNDALYLIVPDVKFNYPATIRHYSYPASTGMVFHWLDRLGTAGHCVFMHWMGGPKPWAKWGDRLNLDLSERLK